MIGRLKISVEQYSSQRSVLVKDATNYNRIPSPEFSLAYYAAGVRMIVVKDPSGAYTYYCNRNNILQIPTIYPLPIYYDGITTDNNINFFLPFATFIEGVYEVYVVSVPNANMTYPNNYLAGDIAIVNILGSRYFIIANVDSPEPTFDPITGWSLLVDPISSYLNDDLSNFPLGYREKVKFSVSNSGYLTLFYDNLCPDTKVEFTGLEFPWLQDLTSSTSHYYNYNIKVTDGYGVVTFFENVAINDFQTITGTGTNVYFGELQIIPVIVANDALSNQNTIYWKEDGIYIYAPAYSPDLRPYASCTTNQRVLADRFTQRGVKYFTVDGNNIAVCDSAECLQGIFNELILNDCTNLDKNIDISNQQKLISLYLSLQCKMNNGETDLASTLDEYKRLAQVICKKCLPPAQAH